MRELPDKCVDLVLTDPPFNVGIDYDETTDDSMSNEDYSSWILSKLIEMERISKDGHPLIIFSGDKKIHPILDAVEKTSLIFHHFIKWNKPNCQRGLSGWVLFYRTELALLLSKGKPNQSILNRPELYSDTLTYDNTKPNDIDAVDHPCRRPVSLYSHLIKGFTQVNDIIFDPFLGSGTTILSCRKNDRIGIGTEINPEYESIIRKRSMIDIASIDDAKWF